ncbi:polyamine aminopropyltransferase [Tumebacillus flagellatus]|uniref:Polyamine aminopropyltransferase n=1 Tax=Tumebacillus flagellatus TaxID=1157490 RepID=A0A074LMT8_9BACL|nr:polyamine aminopropyltransferase [Tumebacillus flagellatus]KEO83436.1 spermidine synthase [Tumebacillus flagellatus]
MELWYTEKQTENYGITAKIEKTLHTEQSEFQRIDLIETNQWGKMLVLDGMVMTTDKDEFVYHEMITHLAMNTHPNPKRVLVVGGGDGGAIREILKYPSIETAVLAEIDGRVIEVSKEYLPEIAGKLEDPRVDVQVVDGIKYIHDNKNSFDVILVDSTEPVGPAVGLFARDFYQGIYEALKEDGIMVAQSESPWFNSELITRVFKDIASIYPVTRYYTASIPTYPSGLWSWTMGSKKYDPLEVDEAKLIEPENTKYYHKGMHKTVFTLPKFVGELLK